MRDSVCLVFDELLLLLECKSDCDCILSFQNISDIWVEKKKLEKQSSCSFVNGKMNSECLENNQKPTNKFSLV